MAVATATAARNAPVVRKIARVAAGVLMTFGSCLVDCADRLDGDWTGRLAPALMNCARCEGR
ncbi:hypothetical protein GCM10018781_72580 [Kitasatospora indigofera]|uniref:Uncharacterized protein n=1 Tax=Kitasatospora indigofera TaxID=67307 RepID=A0A919L4Z8_9ACTN|nr:hypothetical protein GCM10018781_72580 [Kitasatospora indigofera]